MRLFSSDFQTLWRLWKIVIFGIFGILLQTHRYTLSWWVVLSMLVKLVLFTECPMTKTTIDNLWIVISFDLMKFPGSFLHKEFVTVQTFVAWKKTKVKNWNNSRFDKGEKILLDQKNQNCQTRQNESKRVKQAKRVKTNQTRQN